MYIFDAAKYYSLKNYNYVRHHFIQKLLYKLYRNYSKLLKVTNPFFTFFLEHLVLLQRLLFALAIYSLTILNGQSGKIHIHEWLKRTINHSKRVCQAKKEKYPEISLIVQKNLKRCYVWAILCYSNRLNECSLDLM